MNAGCLGPFSVTKYWTMSTVLAAVASDEHSICENQKPCWRHQPFLAFTAEGKLMRVRCALSTPG